MNTMLIRCCGLLAAILGGLVAASPDLRAEMNPIAAQGTESFVNLPSSRASGSRVSGLYYDNQYYIAFSIYDGSDPFEIKYGPGLFWGPASYDESSSSLLFSDGEKLDFSGFPVSAGPNNTWHLSMEILAYSPLIFWTNCNDDNGDIKSISYVQMLTGGGPGNDPTFSNAVSLDSSIVSTLANATDVAVAAYSNNLYLVYARGGSYNDIAILEVIEDAGVISFNVITGLPFTDQSSPIVSIDAVNVTLNNGSEAILIAAVEQTGTNAYAWKAWIWDPAGDQTSIPVSELWAPTLIGDSDYKQYFEYPSIRAAYGPAFQTNSINSVTLFFSAGQYYDSGSSHGTTYWVQSSQLALPEDNTSAASQIGGGPWSSAGDFQSPADPHWWTAFTADLPVGGQEQYSPVYSYICVASIGSNGDMDTEENNAITSSLALQLIPNADALVVQTTDSWTDYTGDDLDNLVASWTLLGVITGVPPMTDDLTTTTSSPLLAISITDSSTSTQALTSQTTVGMQVSAGGDFFGASAGYSRSATSGTTTSGTNTVTINYSTAPSSSGGFSQYASLGYLVVSQPALTQGTYEVYAFDGTTSLGFNLMAMWSDGSNIILYPFDLTDPNSPIAGQSVPAPLLTFPEDSNNKPLLSLPVLTDLVGWQTQPQFTALDPEALYNGDQAVNVGASDVPSLTLTNSSSSTSTTDLNTSYNGSVKALFNFTGSLTMTSSQSLNFSSSTGITINYPAIDAASGYQSYTIAPYIYYRDPSSSDTPNWMPTGIAQSDPWLLTWQVSNLLPADSDTGQDAMLGSFYVGSDTDAGWRYYFSLQQWSYQPPSTALWYYWSTFQDWGWVSPDSRPDNIYLYLANAASWIYSNESDYPWVYDFSTEEWYYQAL